MRIKPFNLLLVITILAISGCSFNKETTPVDITPITGGSVPNSPTPANGSVNQFLYLTLKWECDNAVEYDVYLGETNPPLIKYTTTTNKYYTTPLLKYNTQYYWRVTAKFGDGTTVTSPVWKFLTVTSSSVSGNGYAMYLNFIEAVVPHNINLTFRVIDINGSGVNYLKLKDFEIFEDYLPLSIAESEIVVMNLPTIYNQIKTVLMLDNSTSIEGDTSKIKTSARNIVNGIRPNQEIAIYQFSDKITLLQDYTNDTNLLLNAINKKYTSGVKSTDFYGAVNFGASKWVDESTLQKFVQGCMVIISDGNDTQGSNTLAKALNAVHNKIVFTVGLGNEIQPEILSKLGTAGYFQTGQESEIVNQFKIIEQNLISAASSFYNLSYKSPKRGAGNHSLQIRIVNNSYTGDRSSIITTFNSSIFY